MNLFEGINYYHILSRLLQIFSILNNHHHIQHIIYQLLDNTLIYKYHIFSFHHIQHNLQDIIYKSLPYLGTNYPQSTLYIYHQVYIHHMDLCIFCRYEYLDLANNALVHTLYTFSNPQGIHDIKDLSKVCKLYSFLWCFYILKDICLHIEEGEMGLISCLYHKSHNVLHFYTKYKNQHIFNRLHCIKALQQGEEKGV